MPCEHKGKDVIDPVIIKYRPKLEIAFTYTDKTSKEVSVLRESKIEKETYLECLKCHSTRPLSQREKDQLTENNWSR